VTVSFQGFSTLFSPCVADACSRPGDACLKCDALEITHCWLIVAVGNDWSPAERFVSANVLSMRRPVYAAVLTV
jgi:hypothetical protein